ncbi:uncharacterized protein BDR25DRAFT_225070 [Lindgomyces ingoldianus]|uniref:Uncharacterized protein n=1 Tax=Lindgomyces ingoldianus TaxID=673940 RepID=A0ACB6QUB9_9PLEO|nr:uncharacterized protein BDR25DRAFT_225070 [Lindgomyces ingoldianus]KAF2470614.1 hypothetical protein BDR25DRAFT_225070 [Lindgomyces ingoldianus]
METNQSASRAARRFLVDRVRDDWDWPNAPECWSASDEEVRGVSEFRERYYGTTSSSEPDSETDATNPYKFDSPDSIGAALESKAEARKRKRRMAIESEMAWNEGLSCFVVRRDVWTGAAAVRRYGTNRATRGSNATDPRVPLATPMLANNSIRNSITPKIYSDIYNKIVVSSRTPSVPINLSDMTRALVQGWKDNGEWPPKAGPLDPLAGRKRAAIVGVKMDKGVLHTEEFLSHHPHVKKGMDSVKRMLHLNGHHHEHGAPENHR